MARNWILTMSSFGINIFTSFIPVTAANSLFFFSINYENKHVFVLQFKCYTIGWIAMKLCRHLWPPEDEP